MNGIAISQFNGSDASQISFAIGDTIKITLEHDSGWSKGINISSKPEIEGWFPKEFVKANKDTNASTRAHTADTDNLSFSRSVDAIGAMSTDMQESKSETVYQAKHQYFAMNDTQISFEKNDKIQVTLKHESGWWQGINLTNNQQVKKNKSGWFPAAFVGRPHEGSQNVSRSHSTSITRSTVSSSQTGNKTNETLISKTYSIEAERNEMAIDNNQIKMIVKHDFVAIDDTQIDLKLNDEIYLYLKHKSGWSRGKNLRTQKEGWFPSNFIKDDDRFVSTANRNTMSTVQLQTTIQKQKVSKKHSNKKTDNNMENIKQTDKDTKMALSNSFAGTITESKSRSVDTHITHGKSVSTEFDSATYDSSIASRKQSRLNRKKQRRKSYTGSVEADTEEIESILSTTSQDKEMIRKSSQEIETIFNSLSEKRQQATESIETEIAQRLTNKTVKRLRKQKLLSQDNDGYDIKDKTDNADPYDSNRNLNMLVDKNELELAKQEMKKQLAKDIDLGFEKDSYTVYAGNGKFASMFLDINSREIALFAKYLTTKYRNNSNVKHLLPLPGNIDIVRHFDDGTLFCTYLHDIDETLIDIDKVTFPTELQQSSITKLSDTNNRFQFLSEDQIKDNQKLFLNGLSKINDAILTINIYDLNETHLWHSELVRDYVLQIIRRLILHEYTHDTMSITKNPSLLHLKYDSNNNNNNNNNSNNSNNNIELNNTNENNKKALAMTFSAMYHQESLLDFLRLPVETFVVRWINYHLRKLKVIDRIRNLQSDLKSGLILCLLMISLYPQSIINQLQNLINDGKIIFEIKPNMDSNSHNVNASPTANNEILITNENIIEIINKNLNVSHRILLLDYITKYELNIHLIEKVDFRQSKTWPMLLYLLVLFRNTKCTHEDGTVSFGNLPSISQHSISQHLETHIPLPYQMENDNNDPFGFQKAENSKDKKLQKQASDRISMWIETVIGTDIRSCFDSYDIPKTSIDTTNAVKNNINVNNENDMLCSVSKTGVIPLKLLDAIKPESVRWSKVVFHCTNQFQALSNCAYFINQLKKHLPKIKLVSIGADNIAFEDKKALLSLYFQMMRIHSQIHGKNTKFKLKQLSQYNANNKLNNKNYDNMDKLSLQDKVEKLVQWSNAINTHALYGSDKYQLRADMIIEKNIDNLSKLLSNGFYYIGLVNSILPGIINNINVTSGETQQDKLQNAALAIETAQRIGIPMFISAKDLITSNPDTVLTFIQLMYDGWKLLTVI